MRVVTRSAFDVAVRRKQGVFGWNRLLGSSPGGSLFLGSTSGTRDSAASNRFLLPRFSLHLGQSLAAAHKSRSPGDSCFLDLLPKLVVRNSRRLL